MGLVEAPKISDEEMDLCRKAFQMFDKDGSGTIDSKELKTALSALGQHPSDEELFVMISQVDQDASGEIEFSEFLQAIFLNKSMAAKASNEQDTIDAFVALGGKSDKSGKVLVEKLVAVIQDFELRVDMGNLIGEEGKSELEYEEFRLLLA